MSAVNHVNSLTNIQCTKKLTLASSVYLNTQLCIMHVSIHSQCGSQIIYKTYVVSIIGLNSQELWWSLTYGVDWVEQGMGSFQRQQLEGCSRGGARLSRYATSEPCQSPSTHMVFGTYCEWKDLIHALHLDWPYSRAE